MSSTSTQVIDRAVGIIPIGNKNGQNLIFQAPEKFDPTSLEVFLSGGFLDFGLDFFIGLDNITITIILLPSDPTRLNVAPLQNETFRLNYVRI